MSEQSFHKLNISAKLPPPATTQSPAIITKLVTAYKLWKQYLPLLPKQTRYSLGIKIDSIFIEVIENSLTACFMDKVQKLPFITKTIIKLDTLKFFLQIAWETKSLDNKKYTALSEPLSEIGRMLGGWRNQILKQTSAQVAEGEERKK